MNEKELVKNKQLTQFGVVKNGLCKAAFRGSVFGALIVLSTQALAEFEDDDLPEEGFSWQVAVGLGYSKSEPSIASGGEDRITSLTKRPASETETAPAFNVSGSYTFSNRRTQLGFALDEISLSHYFASGLGLSLSAGLDFLSDDDVYRDPYATNVVRAEQSAKSASYSLGVDGLFGLPLAMEYSYSDLKISNDQAGASLVNAGGAFGITQQEQALLRRSATTHALAFSTELELSDDLLLSPSIGYRVIDAKGAANSAKGFDLGVSLEYFLSEQYALNAGVNYSPSTYDRSHPVFNKVRKDDGMSYSLGMTIDEPFQFEDQQISLGVEYQDEGSNIKFYDSTESSVNMVWSYNF